VAAVSPCPIDSPYLQIPDAVSYNHYFGWYGGDTSMNGPWFDRFHSTHPNIPIGCSEYGCEALDWHTGEARQGDYTEEYQAYYHEQMIKTISERKYLWATFVWNMFDFAADARNEGGEAGMNHKGLVTFDRKYKKDSFFAYKAWLSDEPFVHIAGKGYEKRCENESVITVYSNCDSVELFVNGKSVGKESTKPFFKFKIKNEGESELLAKAGECTDRARIVKVDKFYEPYRLKEVHAVLNWFDITEREGRFSLNDKISDILATEKGKTLFEEIVGKIKNNGSSDFEINEESLKMLGGFSFIRFASLSEMMGIKFTREELLDINRRLNEISK
jgi:beta-galactosidase